MNEKITKNSISGQTEWLLASLVEASRKSHIKEIAGRYGVKVSDKMTKQQMTEAIVPVLELNAGIRLKQYSQTEMKLLLDCFRNDNIDENTALQILDSAPYADGVVFLSVKKDVISAIIPKELAGKVMMHCASHCFLSDEDKLTRTARACAMIYGRFTPALLAKVFHAAYVDQSVTPEEAEAFLSQADCPEFSYENGEAVYRLAPPAPHSEWADGLEEALPTRREIEAYAAYGLDSTNYYYRQAVHFIYNNQNASYENANLLMRKIAVWCVTDGDLQDIFDFVQTSEMPISVSQFEFLLNMLGELSDKTRKQSLKGHRHCDVVGVPPIVMPQLVIKRTDELFDGNAPRPIHVGQKIGRNDPCPCGSGKKYKKCCGRTMK